jgi:hypothetical protein
LKGIALTVALVVALGLTWLYVKHLIRKRQAQRQVNPLLRVYESRLLAACSGNYAVAERLIQQELQRSPGINRLNAARRSYMRLKKKRPPVAPGSHERPR